MSRRTKHSHVNPAVPPYLTYEEQLFVEMFLATDDDLKVIQSRWPKLTAEECARLAADARVRAECEYRRDLVEGVRAGRGVEPRIGHNAALEYEHITNACSEAHTHERRGTAD